MNYHLILYQEVQARVAGYLQDSALSLHCPDPLIFIGLGAVIGVVLHWFVCNERRKEGN